MRFFPHKYESPGCQKQFARIIEWEFPDFSVAKCFDRLVKVQEQLDRDGKIEGTIHRYLIAARKH